MNDQTSSLIVERDGPILTLTMNRPERGNSLSLDMVGRLAAAWELADGDEDIRCVILTGTGSRYYCTGGDLASGWMASGYQPESDAEREVVEDPGRIGKALLLTYWLRTPLVAAVNGACLGGGCEMLQQTDIRVGEEHATFALPETGRGLIPAAGSTMRLKRQLPYAIAMEMLLTGRQLDAEEALRWGLINHVVATRHGLAKAREIAEAICAKGPLAVASTKASAVETGWLPEEVAQVIEAGYAQVVTRSADAREGMAAFVAKRPPRFTGG
jgi:enoyl-CoA hydratase